MNMKKWMEQIQAEKVKKPLPILAFPCVQLMGITVKQLIADGKLQAQGMKEVAQRTDSLAAVSFMDLSLEAEAFGADIKTSDMEVPTVIGTLIKDMKAAEKLEVPSLEAGRIGLCLEGVNRAKALIQDRPVFAGIIGPFSLTGRLVDVNRAFLYCKKQPQLLHTVLRKAADFLIDYANAYKAAGADGIVMAEPLAGMLSPKLAQGFSEPYVKEIAGAVKDDDFLVIYHNCGNAALKMASSIMRIGCDAYHFGNAIDMASMLELFPEDTLVMGNIDPAGQFTNGTPESMREAVLALMEGCSKYPNFIPSSGCDIPPAAKWENIDAFFQAVKDYYEGN